MSFHDSIRIIKTFTYEPASIPVGQTQTVFTSDDLGPGVDYSMPMFLKLRLMGGGSPKGPLFFYNQLKMILLARIHYEDGFAEYFPYPGGMIVGSSAADAPITSMSQLQLAMAELTIPLRPLRWSMEVRVSTGTNQIAASLASGQPIKTYGAVYAGVTKATGWGKLMGESPPISLGNYDTYADFCWPQCETGAGTASPGAFIRIMNGSATTHNWTQSPIMSHDWFTTAPTTPLEAYASSNITTGATVVDDVEATSPVGGFAYANTMTGTFSNSRFRFVGGFRY